MGIFSRFHIAIHRSTHKQPAQQGKKVKEWWHDFLNQLGFERSEEYRSQIRCLAREKGVRLFACPNQETCKNGAVVGIAMQNGLQQHVDSPIFLAFGKSLESSDEQP